jgi:hypothetical protein
MLFDDYFFGDILRRFSRQRLGFPTKHVDFLTFFLLSRTKQEMLTEK